MSNIVLLLNILLVTTHAMHAMDDPDQTPKKKPLPHLPLSRMDSKKKMSKVPQIPLNTIQNDYLPLPAISITDPIVEEIKLQKTLSRLLDLESQDTSFQLSRNRMVPGKKAAKIENNLREHLLPKQEIKANPRKLPLALDKAASFSSGDSPSTSPRKKSSPSHQSHKKLTTSSPYSSPRENKSSHSSPRELITYDDVIKAFTQKLKITKTVKAFLHNEDNDPNQQDKATGLTILHRAVLQHDKKTTELMLSCPKTKIDTPDYNSRKALDFIKDEITTYEKLFRALKAREFVDLIINALMITNNLLQDPHCPQGFMRDIINAFLEKTLPKTLPKYTDGDFFIAAIRYRQADQLSLLKDFHKQYKKNLNYQDKLGNTMWHYAAIVLDNILITRLASNAFLDSSIRNKEHCIAAQLIPSSSNIKTEHLTDTIIKKIQYLKYLRTLLFTRDSLELLCAKEAPMIKKLICPDISTFTLYKEIKKNQIELNPDFIQAKKVIEEGFKIIARGQGDSDLPQEADFPDYAKNEFVYEKLKIKMQAEDPFVESTQLVLEKLLEEFKKESDLIQSGQTKLKHIVIEKKSEPKKDPDTISKPINDQDPLVSKSSED